MKRALEGRHGALMETNYGRNGTHVEAILERVDELLADSKSPSKGLDEFKQFLLTKLKPIRQQSCAEHALEESAPAPSRAPSSSTAPPPQATGRDVDEGAGGQSYDTVDQTSPAAEPHPSSRDLREFLNAKRAARTVVAAWGGGGSSSGGPMPGL